MTGGSARSVGVRASGDAGVALACGAAGQWAWRGAKLACGGMGRARRLGRVGAASWAGRVWAPGDWAAGSWVGLRGFWVFWALGFLFSFPISYSSHFLI